MKFWNRQPKSGKASIHMKADMRRMQADLERAAESIEKLNTAIRERDERIAILESAGTVKDEQIKLLAAINELNHVRVQAAIGAAYSEPSE